MSPRVWLCVISSPIDLFLSFECPYILSQLFTFFIQLIIHVVGTAEHKRPCAPAEWGVWPCGDTNPSYTPRT